MRVSGHRWMIAVAAILAATACVGDAATAAAETSKDDLLLISRATSGAGADDDSLELTMTGSGRTVYFNSAANNLGGPTGDHSAIYRHRVLSGETEVVSDSIDAQRPAVAPGGFPLTFQDGTSSASACPGGEEGYWQVYAERSAERILVSRAYGIGPEGIEGGPPGDADSRNPSVSGDGHWAAFESRATNLASAAPGCTSLIYVRDIRDPGLEPSSYDTVLESVANDGSTPTAYGGGDTGAYDPVISETGRYIVFRSIATNLAPGSNGGPNIFWRDTYVGGRGTLLVSHATGGVPQGGYESAMTPDGRFVAYSGLPPDDAEGSIGEVIYVRDMVTDDLTIVSRADGPSGIVIGGEWPSISDDGRYVSFLTNDSRATGVALGDAKNAVVRDLETGKNYLASRAHGPDGAPAAAGADEPQLSGNGRYLAFTSEDDHLSGIDSDGTIDVFLRDVLGPPSSGTAEPEPEPEMGPPAPNPSPPAPPAAAQPSAPPRSGPKRSSSSTQKKLRQEKLHQALKKCRKKRKPQVKAMCVKKARAKWGHR
jgi:hypothetical protein